MFASYIINIILYDFIVHRPTVIIWVNAIMFI